MVLCVSLCACGGNGSSLGGGSKQFTVTCNDGTTEELSLEELQNLAENELQFEKKYKGAYISGKGKVYEINKDHWKGDTIISVTINIDDFKTEIQHVPAEYAEDYNIGDEIEVRGTIENKMKSFAVIEADESFYD